jgi:hypothetical protein
MQKIEFLVIDRHNPDRTTPIKTIEWPFDELPVKDDSILDSDDRIFKVRWRFFDTVDAVVKIYIDEE